MSRPTHSHWLSFAFFLVGSYVLAIATAVALAVTWIEGIMWVGVAAFVAWLALIVWGAVRFGVRAAWAVLGFLAINPVTIFAGAVTYTCAVNGACL